VGEGGGEGLNLGAEWRCGREERVGDEGGGGGLGVCGLELEVGSVCGMHGGLVDGDPQAEIAREKVWARVGAAIGVRDGTALSYPKPKP
jgi:hypothetical protein